MISGSIFAWLPLLLVSQLLVAWVWSRGGVAVGLPLMLATHALAWWGVLAPNSPLYGPVLVTLAHGVLSGAVCQFLGGGAREIGVATVLGLGLGAFALLAGRHPRLGRVFESVAAFLVSAMAIALARLVGPLSLFVTTLAGLIVTAACAPAAPVAVARRRTASL